MALGVLVAGAWAGNEQSPYLIDDFEGPAALANWRVHSDPEPAPTGSGLSLGVGHQGHGAVLGYRGGLVEAVWSPATPVPKVRDAAVSLWIRFPPELQVSLVAKDAPGHAVRFPIRSTLEHLDPGAWQYAVVPLSLAPDEGGRITGKLVEIRIVVQGTVQGALRGDVSFDDIRLRTSSEILRIDAATHFEPPPKWFPAAPLLGVNVHLLRDDHALDLARAAGFQFVRMDMMWANIERAGRYRFGPYDALLRALESRGMSVLWILDYGHPDHGGSVPRSPADIAAFVRFVEAAAEHFKGRNVRYEVWNEPNNVQFWPPSPNPSEYAALLKEGLAAIHRADPSAEVSSGGVSGIDAAFLSRALDANLTAGLAAIGIHPYRKTGPETVASELTILRDWVARTFGEQLEIWDTEWGYSSADAVHDAPSNGHAEASHKRQAALAVREMLTVRAAGFPLAVWYDLRDDGTEAENPEQNYGLLDSSGNEKPSMTALRTLMDAVGNRKYAGILAEAPAGIHAMRFDGSADTILIVWTDQAGGKRVVDYAKRDLISATGMMGEAIKSRDAGAGRARVELSSAAGPVYLHWNGALPPP